MGKIFVFGAGGFGREVVDLIRDCYNYSEKDIKERVFFLDSNPALVGQVVSGLDVIHPDRFRASMGKIALAIGAPDIREKVVKSLPKETEYISLIHPNVIIGRNTKIGKGAIICAGNIITCDINIGDFTQLNLNGTLGHDCSIGNYFTTAPCVNLSGSLTIGDRVYFGTQSATRQGLHITDDVTVGMSACVVKDLNESGIYVGTPAKLMKR